ncbi:hypothetical protein AYI70_g4641 [Smittium culicis]|uniref:Transmembrane protein n=1 Tax=Smittium culicis TaxID=133412 RepID=A0A1R1XYA7_9FUNG|nr:hypothetical protein AYI70_g4641 [Smittium culicis]
MSNIFTNPESRNTIILGTAATSTLGASIGGAYAVLKYVRPFRKPILTMAASWGLVGFTYFVFRQSLLFEQQQKSKAYNLKASQTMDSDTIFSSTTAGVLVGGLYGGISGGKSGVVFGMLALGTIGYTSQKIYTSLYRYRQKLIIKELNLDPSQNQFKSEEEIHKDIGEMDGYNYQPNSLAAKLRRYVNDGFLNKFPKWFPVRTITNDEYIKILDVREQEIFERLIQIDEDLVVLNNIIASRNSEN